MTSQPHLERIPFNTLAIAFGLAGLASVWTASSTALGIPEGFSDAAWLITAIAWVWLIVAHVRRGRLSATTLLSQLRHPVQGPIAALAPIVGMLLAAALHRVSPLAGTILVSVFIAIAALFAAWLISTWLSGGMTIDAVHGGYFLPTVAGGLIAAIAAAEVGLPNIALGAFAVGAFFWVAMSTLIMARLMFGSPLAPPLVPTMAIFVAPPAVAGTAWALIAGPTTPVEVALGAMTILMLLIQLAFAPLYFRLKFSLGFWSFTFPFAAVASYGVSWLARIRPWGWQALVITIALGITLLVAVIMVKSIQLWTTSHAASSIPASPDASDMPVPNEVRA